MNVELIKTDYFRERRVDVIVIDGVEYWIVDQIARALEYKETRYLYDIINRRWINDFEEGEIKKIPKTLISDDLSLDVGLGEYSYILCVSEQGLYTILFNARTRIAKEFRNWLKREVLPSIRKKGYYISERADLKQLEVDLARIKSNDYHLLDKQLDRLEQDENTDQRWISHSRMLLVADITGQRIDFEMEVNLSDFIYRKRGRKANKSELISFGREVAKLYRKVRGKEPLKTKKQLDTGIRDVNYYTVEDIPIIEKAYEEWGGEKYERLL